MSVVKHTARQNELAGDQVSRVHAHKPDTFFFFFEGERNGTVKIKTKQEHFEITEQCSGDAEVRCLDLSSHGKFKIL